MKPTLITGGAGFVGANLASRLLSAGHPVIILDNLSRAGVKRNLRWLRAKYSGLLHIKTADIRDRAAVADVISKVGCVYHLAAQTAVTTSLADPYEDFEVNVAGTLQVLEAIRVCAKPPFLLFTSTNKVYGSLDGVQLRHVGHHYEPEDERIRLQGVSETYPLNFHTPYGCSKGTADQYVLDYARSYGLRATVFRMSCIYGPHQCGTEDQGWVAHFVLRALSREVIRIYGDGGQVRDLLYIDDLVNALLLARKHAHATSGEAFNIGGGASNVASVLDVFSTLKQLAGVCSVEFNAWRPSDQRYYVSDTRKFSAVTAWRPTISVQQGIEHMYNWFVRTYGPRSLSNVSVVRGAKQSVVQ